RGEILLCADANSKSAIWGSPTEDKRGEQFAEMLDVMDLTVMNAGNAPTFDGPRGTSFVDHVGPSLYRDNDERNRRNRNRERRFLQQEGRQGHIQIHIRGNMRTTTRKHSDLHKRRATRSSGKSHERQSCAASMRARRKFQKSIPWWTPELTQLRKEVRNLVRRYQRITNQDREGNKTEYMRAFYAYKTRLLQTRMEKWREFCTENTETDPWGLAYRAINRRRPDQYITCVRNKDGTFTRTVNETAAAVLE
ncbi:hypothetical protein CBL_21462, partial [Carabus blaptoides fortunei]